MDTGLSTDSNGLQIFWWRFREATPKPDVFGKTAYKSTVCGDVPGCHVATAGGTHQCIGVWMRR
jgi:hypothetical protein